MRSALPVPGDQSAPGGGFPVSPPPPADAQAQKTALLVAAVVQAARQLGMMYPAANQEMRTVLNLMTQVQQKIVNSRPAPEPSAPPV